MPTFPSESAQLDAERQLLQTLRKIEALAAGTTFDGERTAATAARERILERLREVRAAEPDVETRFSLVDPWSRSLFMAILRRYGLKPYRYPGQRRTTVMARMPRRFLDDVLWPEFLQVNRVLQDHLFEVTERIIKQGVDGDTSEAAVEPQQAALNWPAEKDEDARPERPR